MFFSIRPYRLSLIALLLWVFPYCAFAEARLGEAFANPPLEFRPAIIRHGHTLNRPKDLEALRARRSGGVVLDVGTSPGSQNDGLPDEVYTNATYLNDAKRFEALRSLMTQLKQEKAPVWIYDELAYPSASAGGHVIKGHPEFAPEVIGARVLTPDSAGLVKIAPAQGAIYACYAAPIIDDVFQLDQAIDLSIQAMAGSFHWKAPTPAWQVCILDHYYPDTWKRHNIYRRFVNIMNKDAIERFIAVTHEKYAQELGPQLADVFSFFTDEPQLGSVENWSAGLKDCEAMVPWSPRLARLFEAKKGYAVRAILPALFLEVGEKTSKYRYDYYDVVSDAIATHYFKAVEDWCHAHGTLSSGHMLLEESLLLHLMFSGSMMKNWAHMDLPGVDLLLGAPYKTMPGWEAGAYAVPEDFSNKLASSVAHLREKSGVFTESFALAKISLQAAKGVAAWQYAGGVTHMTTYTIQQTFSAEDYASFSDFTGRLAYLCRRGVHQADVAVLVPEAAVWASYTPPDGGRFARYIACNPEPAHIDQVFRNSCHSLSKAQRDFDCMDESMLLDATIEAGKLSLAKESFAFLVLPEARMLSWAAAKKVAAFVQGGGQVIFIGELASHSPAHGADPKLRAFLLRLVSDYPEQVKHVDSVIAFEGLFTWMGERHAPALTWEGAEAIRILHRREMEHGDLKQRDIVLIANPSAQAIQGTLRLSVGGALSCWDPESGAVEAQGDYTAQDAIAVQVGAQSARFIVLEGL